MESTDRVSLQRSDFAGFEWIIDMQGTIERLLDRIDRAERAPNLAPSASEAAQ